ncbi:MAG: hypothetical protein AAF518_19090 [Spirochaetota bacterium]
MISEYGSRKRLPLILVPGFVGLDSEKDLAYQGFNIGTVNYHQKGSDYIYEGFVLKLVKEEQYLDATNVIGFYSKSQNFSPFEILSEEDTAKRQAAEEFDESFFKGRTVLHFEQAELFRWNQIDSFDPEVLWKSIWVFRYFDYNSGSIDTYGEEFYKFIRIILAVTKAPAVNIIAHSIGGLLVRSALQKNIPWDERNRTINKFITLSTPHRGFKFQLLPDQMTLPASLKELAVFSPKAQNNAEETLSYKNYSESLKKRTLCVAGTNYKSFTSNMQSLLGQFYADENNGGKVYNKSDGLVKQNSALLDGTYSTFVHKSHADSNSLLCSREIYEIASRFFFGDYLLRIRYLGGMIKMGNDWIGKSEFFLGVSLKPRAIDFELFHQSREAENCYGPFEDVNLTKVAVHGKDFGDSNLIYTGFLDSSRILKNESDLVFRLSLFISERDTFGVGFSDEVILNKQYYIQIKPEEMLFKLHNKGFSKTGGEVCKTSSENPNCFLLEIKEDGFEGKFTVEYSKIPD